MNNYKFRFLLTSFALIALLFAFNSCNDSWDNHYKMESGMTSDSTLWEQIKSNANLSDFSEVVEKTYVYYNDRKTEVSYADMLNSDQSFTIWAPVNGSFNKDSLLALLESPLGSLDVENGFLKNQMTRYPISVTSSTDEMVTMLNKKLSKLNGLSFGSVKILTPNILSKNGILHLIDGKVAFLHNIYELVTTNVETSLLGSYLKAFQKDSLDEFSSVSSGIIDGKTVYVDSVIIEKNSILSEIGFLNNEDSTYWMIAPTDSAWNVAKSKIGPYYNYGSVAFADSLKNFWTKNSLIYDLVYNPKLQKSFQDSLISTRYKSQNPLYHVYYKPNEAGGILSDVKEKIACSNGFIYKVDKWPFNIKNVFFQAIKVEAEKESNILNYSMSTINIRKAINLNISGDRFLDLVPSKVTFQPSITFEIANTLSGKYDICVVCVPKTAYMIPTNAADSSIAFRPFKFRASLSYTDATGKVLTNTFSNAAFTNNPNKLDTVCIASSFKFPVCNYKQDITTVSLKLQVYVLSSETKTHSREMYIDCIYLKPRED